ncbi:MAG: DUF3467 domain-containing protein [Planctomycetota bacterium]
MNDAADTKPARIAVQVEDAGLESRYANAFNVHPGGEELTIDFAYQMPPVRAQQGQADAPAPDHDATMRVKVGQRISMTYGTAQRLHQALQQAISHRAAQAQAAQQQANTPAS